MIEAKSRSNTLLHKHDNKTWEMPGIPERTKLEGVRAVCAQVLVRAGVCDLTCLARLPSSRVLCSDGAGFSRICSRLELEKGVGSARGGAAVGGRGGDAPRKRRST